MNNIRRLHSAVVAAALVTSTTVGLSGCGGGTSSTSGSVKDSHTQQPSSGGATPSPGSTKPTASTPRAKPAKPVPVENNPPGDIPDNLAFIRYANKPGAYSFTHPEGWARSGHGVQVRFTDKLNGVTAESLSATQAPTVSSAKSSDVPRIRAAVPAFQLRDITSVTLPAGRGVHIVFRRNSAPDPVTGKVYRDEVEEYAVFRHGRLVRLDLYGPVGADNVDAYRTMSESLTIQ
jgi:hypothetical protein